jgi:hypothetical protein
MCTCSRTPRTRSAFVLTRPITQASLPPSPSVGCLCLGSSNTQTTPSTFTTSPLVWSWRTTSWCTSTPPRLASRQVVSPLSPPTSRNAKRSRACFQAGTLCSGRGSMLVLASYPSIRVRSSSSRPMSTIGSFRSRFFPLESTACRCGLPMETVSHVLYHCPLYEREEVPSEKLPYKWLVDFLITNENAFTFDVH